ncbi:thioesterase II family protein [Oceanicella sp. SM1341]|uniref:thioesterase II family protein n=1 Tax=Oceanicella sp. SM1341 TaxID=1548889 RepID=UPI001300B486|nr:thioesterase domain-containing protein [Oceanicella sp. SM1341]
MLPELICLPPAGAGPGLFRAWRTPAAGRVRLRPLALPGREARFGEPLPESLGALAEQLAGELAPALPPRYALFGYSMGAVLGYELIRRLLARGCPGPEALFLLGSNPPDRMLEGESPIHLLDGPAFRAELGRIGGTPPEILANAEAMALFESILRHDFRLCETHVPRPVGPAPACPAHVLVSAQDHLVSAEGAEGWRAFLAGEVTLHRLEGGHMLSEPAFAALLERVLALWEPARLPA